MKNPRKVIGDDYGRLPDWKPATPRLKGYPY
jgi:hypothetical protein